jgi:hypothetical protein
MDQILSLHILQSHGPRTDCWVGRFHDCPGVEEICESRSGPCTTTFHGLFQSSNVATTPFPPCPTQQRQINSLFNHILQLELVSRMSGAVSNCINRSPSARAAVESIWHNTSVRSTATARRTFASMFVQQHFHSVIQA